MPKTVSEYIDSLPKEAKNKIKEIRLILKKAAPFAKEAIKWGYPVLEYKRILFSYSAHKNHINFMPTGPSMKPFKEELKNYKTGKDTIQFT